MLRCSSSSHIQPYISRQAVVRFIQSGRSQIASPLQAGSAIPQTSTTSTPWASHSLPLNPKAAKPFALRASEKDKQRESNTKKAEGASGKFVPLTSPPSSSIAATQRRSGASAFSSALSKSQNPFKHETLSKEGKVEDTQTAESGTQSANKRATKSATSSTQSTSPISSTSTSSSTTTATTTKPLRKFRPRKAAIKLTDNAVLHVKQLLDSPTPKLIKVGVKNRGCSGLTYHLEYVEKPGPFDEEVVQDGVKVLIDSKALFSIIGSEMDYVDDKLSSRFVFNNPNIKGECGCGESFMV